MTVARRRRVFGWLLVTAVAAFLTYEGYALWTPEPGDAISEIVWSFSCGGVAFVPFVAGLAVGGLAGHFFWQRRGPRCDFNCRACQLHVMGERWR